jgi:hypothetical protein
MSYNPSRSNHFSGEVLPLILREKLRQQSRTSESFTSTSSSSAAITTKTKTIARVASGHGLSVADRNRICTADELEDDLWKTSQALLEIQRQIVRGEEVYYEETQAYGSNLFRGWETFIDSRDVGGTSNNTNTTTVQSGGPRRVPNDFRWFSGSAVSLASRHLKPEPMGSRVSSTVTSASRSSTCDVSVSAVETSTMSAVPVVPVSTVLVASDVLKKVAGSIAEAPAPTCAIEELDPKEAERPADVDSKNKEATDSSKEESEDVVMDDNSTKESEPATPDESKREKRKALSESADSTKDDKDSPRRRTKRKRRSGAN